MSFWHNLINRIKDTSHLSSYSVLYFIIIVVVGIVIRINYFPYQLPLELDGLTYFSYAYELSRSGQFPINYDLPNNGWSIFLAGFFWMFSFDDFTQYVLLTRLISMTISIITFIPAYFLYRNFFPRNISLIGASIVILDGRMISNSLLGITEPLSIILIITTIVFFLKKGNSMYLAFMTISFATIVRYESILLIAPMSIMFFREKKFLKKHTLRYLVCLFIVMLILIPITLIRTETMGKDGIISHLFAGVNSIYIYKISDLSEEQKLKMNVSDEAMKEKEPFFNFLGRTLVQMIKFNFLLLTPYLLFAVIGGCFFLIRNRKHIKLDYKILTIVLITVVMFLPAFYAYARGISEIRYLFAIIPLSAILALYFIKQIKMRFERHILILSMIGCVIISSSVMMLEINKKDYSSELDIFRITNEVMSIAQVINTPSIEGNYITTVKVLENWPKIKSPTEVKNIKISTNGFDSLESFIQHAKHQGLTHIVVDDTKSAPEFINVIFNDENKYPYLKKVYDSKDLGYVHHVKVFEIDYDLFNQALNNN